MKRSWWAGVWLAVLVSTLSIAGCKRAETTDTTSAPPPPAGAPAEKPRQVPGGPIEK